MRSLSLYLSLCVDMLKPGVVGSRQSFTHDRAGKKGRTSCKFCESKVFEKYKIIGSFRGECR